jgi:hypothetical protein
MGDGYQQQQQQQQYAYRDLHSQLIQHQLVQQQQQQQQQQYQYRHQQQHHQQLPHPQQQQQHHHRHSQYQQQPQQHQSGPRAQLQPQLQGNEPLVFLDGDESPLTQTWLIYGHGGGRPAVKQDAGGACLLDDPRGCMEVAQEVLRANFAGGGDESLPPLGENILLVLRQLGMAAGAAGMG